MRVSLPETLFTVPFLYPSGLEILQEFPLCLTGFLSGMDVPLEHPTGILHARPVV
jgi:hypothetical protein